MKPMFKIRIPILIFATATFAVEHGSAQRQITSIVTNNSTGAAASYTGVKGSGIRNASNVLSANWDSTGTSFRVNFSATSNNIKSITQFSMAGSALPFTQQSTPSFVRIRRQGNGYVNNTGNHYNYWSVYNTVPANGSTTGAFNLVAPEITVPETAFESNNINSGYDNIF